MNLQFEDSQPHQMEAIDAVAELFDGQPPIDAGLYSPVADNAASGGFAPSFMGAAVYNVRPNRLDLSDGDLLKNLLRVQRRRGIRPDKQLESIELPLAGRQAEGATDEEAPKGRFGNYSVEMETGTGKTYVYIRTALELNRRYGFRKFIIVVPSVAIREGVLGTFRDTRAHFAGLFGNAPYKEYAYDSSDVSQIRDFATSEGVRFMVMTIDSFNKEDNVIRRDRDQTQGAIPLQLVQATRPILILDEPQRMGSDKALAALASLDPLFALRYSATHRVPYNVVHRLLPAQAYREGLVKKVEVLSVIRQGEHGGAYIRVDKIDSAKKTVTAKIVVHAATRGGDIRPKPLTVKPGTKLWEKTGRSEYEGLEVDEINKHAGYVRFATGVKVKLNEEAGADSEAVQRAMVRQTIAKHIERQEELAPRGIKVLSLFFIDAVDRYAPPDAPLRKIFEEEYARASKGSAHFKEIPAAEAHRGYFASKRKRDGSVEVLDSKTGGNKEDSAAYDLIMRDKRSLLSFPEAGDDEETSAKKRVSFIFSHSALREGWDNPNVFQVCVLRGVSSPGLRRQQVGRGVRLAVDQTGVRVRDDGVNILTVVAGEDFAKFVKGYQLDIAEEFRAEIEAKTGKAWQDLSEKERLKIIEEFGEGILPPPPRDATRKRPKLIKERVLSSEFQELWERIKHKTKYSVEVDTVKVVTETAKRLDAMELEPPRIAFAVAGMEITDQGAFEARAYGRFQAMGDLSGRVALPPLIDVVMELLSHARPVVRVTRQTVLDVLRACKSKSMAVENPYGWATAAAETLREVMAEHLCEGISYTRMVDDPSSKGLPDSEKWYEMRLIEDESLIDAFTRLTHTPEAGTDRTIYSAVPCHSGLEVEFAKALDSREDVLLYVKLPRWFRVKTPVGDYEPDWAVVVKNPSEDGEPILYLVAETKPDVSEERLRPREKFKIRCAERHFGVKKRGIAGALKGVDYKRVSSAMEVPW